MKNIAAAIFLLVFSVYLFTLFPSVAPYRDSGEMVSVAHTLGVAHPPGYPLYTLVSKLFILLVPFGSEGYRLNVLSALAGGLTAFLLFRILLALSIRGAFAACLALVFSFSYLQWYLSLVPEMYTLNTLFAAAALYLAIRNKGRPRMYYLLAFLFGLGLGNRMDLLLIAPGVLWLVFKERGTFTLKDHAVAGLLFAGGASVFMYLLIRSNAGPLLDWNHPATLDRLWGTLTRRTHGGTLDLISSGYAPGENFPAAMRFYFSHLLTGFAYAGLPLAAAGILSLWRKNRNVAIATLAAWLVSGPVFIYLGNMPPNTHALAILEAHFLLPNLFVALWMAAGLEYFIELLQIHPRPPLIKEGVHGSPPLKRGIKGDLIGVCCAAALVGYNLFQHFPDLDKRQSYFAYDYAKNLLRSLPPGSTAVMKKDVQLFALWNQQYVENKRPDLAIVSQGLAGAEWYKASFGKRHPGIFLGPLRTREDWGAFVKMNGSRPVYFTGDAEYYRPEGFVERPHGLVSEITAVHGKERSGGSLFEIYARRGRYFYPAYREFFTPDLIEGYARARVQDGLAALEKGKTAEAREYLQAALRMQPLLPFAANYAAYTYFSEGKYEAAAGQYKDAALQYEKMLSLAERYNSLSGVKDGLRKELSDVFVSLGVTAERLGRGDEGFAWYGRALEAWPVQDKAYYNRAVLLWKKSDWPGVTRDLEQALRINPGHREAAYYLQLARQRINK